MTRDPDGLPYDLKTWGTRSHYFPPEAQVYTRKQILRVLERKGVSRGTIHKTG